MIAPTVFYEWAKGRQSGSRPRPARPQKQVLALHLNFNRNQSTAIRREPMCSGQAWRVEDEPTQTRHVIPP